MIAPMSRLIIALIVACSTATLLAQQTRSNPCDPDNGGLRVPDGFCAKVVADVAAPARHVAVGPSGDIYTVLAVAGGPLAPPPSGPPTPAVIALRDADRDGKYEQQEKFGPGLQGTGILWRDGYLYVGSNTQVVRFRMDGKSLVPSGQPEVIVDALPRANPHSAKSIAIGDNGALYVHVGGPTNACQNPDRRPGAPGENPCSQLELHGGVWKYEAGKAGQKHDAAHRFATGIRHTVAMAWNPAARQLYATQNGRDQLDTLWPKSFTAQDNADRPAEEMQLLKQGANFGWPYCFYDLQTKKRLRNPEYGGDGKSEGDCAKYEKPIATFPAHNAPVGMVFYTGTQFPAEYRNGAFVTFHGSWNRSPFPMDGFNIRFVPFKGDTPAGDSRVFASGFAGKDVVKGPNDAVYRPVGVAQAPDGSLIVTDDSKGRIWRISYTGRR
jgi:glucose/arabinose dehydrogenase